MRKKIIAGNWKMNTTIQEAEALLQNLNKTEKECIVCVPYTHLSMAKEKSTDNIKIGAQNISQHEKGAYTGEVSGMMLQSLDINYVLIGHSERRTYFLEDNALLKEKIDVALKNNIRPIFCCGESLEMRENGDFKSFIFSQIKETLFHLSAEDFAKIVVAYEPIWAIGTGKTASAEQAQEVHNFIRQKIAEKYGSEVAENTTILYGGSVKPSNAAELFACKDIDGGLVGGASLVADSFIQIINAQS